MRYAARYASSEEAILLPDAISLMRNRAFVASRETDADTYHHVYVALRLMITLLRVADDAAARYHFSELLSPPLRATLLLLLDCFDAADTIRLPPMLLTPRC